MSLNCPLCLHHEPVFYHQDKQRDYYQCTVCSLVFVPPAHHPSQKRELSEYQLHENDNDDPGYRRFLSKAALPLLQRVTSLSRGLDFGCGPAPVLAQMLLEEGHTMSVYDPFFHPDDSVLAPSYDFITCTEAIEHFHTPYQELMLLDSLLKQGGWLCIMTKRVLDKTRFASWHYKNDPTHVSFFSDETFRYLGEKYHYTVHLVASDVVLMHKQSYNSHS
ncbi:class I SAM-dependent methyltransferase [Salinimonas sp. HHU 13199]|uniref:Class I SAM-dependent methyltransferase n=1 Tax=Salinimonas profundi TaxID=2729140 RepID=A0ABR8LKH2_9ALTE|nr:class I SAM-dependent methyltransferase [Salinimonas profundi]MBD3585825.1 class I SAM-dependent methyltransferase [Salinimonas profundi]